MTDPLIAILTDFGQQDPFVGIMKTVIAGICPRARTIDLTHEIPPGDIRRAAIMLWQSIPFSPPGATLLVVVDPGVGTTRKGIVLQMDRHVFVGPDNGLASFIRGPSTRQWILENSQYFLPTQSHTFHGRDIFAPAAAHIACGVPLEDFGSEIEQTILLPEPLLRLTDGGGIEGEALHADRFGNILTSIGQLVRQKGRLAFIPWRPGIAGETFSASRPRLSLPSGRHLQMVSAFGSLAPGEPGFLIGSSGLIEIVANRARAEDVLKIEPGARIKLQLEKTAQGDC